MYKMSQVCDYGIFCAGLCYATTSMIFLAVYTFIFYRFPSVVTIGFPTSLTITPSPSDNNNLILEVGQIINCSTNGYPTTFWWTNLTDPTKPTTIDGAILAL